MELNVLNVGLDLGVISPRLYTMLVVMALATTLMTSPLLGVLWPAARAATAVPPARRPATAGLDHGPE
jgi:hypothetical protein